MKVSFIEEPLLEFAGGGRHIDPKHGVWHFGPADVSHPSPRVVKAAIVGTQASIDGFRAWLDKCSLGIGAMPNTHLTHLYIPFPGFDTTLGFRSTVNFTPRLTRVIPKRRLDGLEGLHPKRAVANAVEIYDAALQSLHDEPSCDVVIVCRPDNLNDAALSKAPKNADDVEIDGSRSDGRNSGFVADFHALLKARSLRYKQPIQIVRRNTWDPTFKDPHTGRIGANQDEATRAWNLHTALYYKNGGVPWRLSRDPSDLSSCYIGIAFYKSAASSLHTSVAQIYNQRGDGIIVRGGPATISKEDRQPHLAEEDALELLETALQRYRAEHLHAPARIVLHKASNYTPEERAGFNQAANNERLALLEMLWLTNSETIRLYRKGQQPPLRGTFLTVDEDRHLLYTTGAIPFYKTYPGHYVPQPLGIRVISADSSPDALAAEILALTKMNWNNTRLDGSIPVTLRTARTVGNILRHHDTDAPASGRYAHYM
ncbi:hypothetical protein OG563_28490 [Nocardia vinacea]|uniref:Protein argonaute n=1 Tax=Nocardia vinacea TaxID=96468 RepID=A0ABZ1YME7_9NOCA|nr:hypothetical protein [Nocardia vinacea]